MNDTINSLPSPVSPTAGMPLSPEKEAFYSRITGKIQFVAHHAPDGIYVESVEAVWQGGDTIAVTQAFLDDVDPRVVQRDDSHVRIGHFEVELMEYFPDVCFGGAWLAKRKA